MQKFVFDSVKDAVVEIDVSATHTKIKNAGGIAWLTSSGADLDTAEEYASALLNFIETCELKRELERIFAENGKIDLTSLPDAPFDGGLEPGYFASTTALKRLYASTKARRTRVPGEKSENVVAPVALL